MIKWGAIVGGIALFFVGSMMAFSVLAQETPIALIGLEAATRRPIVQNEVFGFHPYWMGDSYKNYRYDLLTTIAFFEAELEGSGVISDLHGWPVEGLTNLAHENGVRVVLVAKDFTASKLETLLSTPSNRQNAIRHLLDAVKMGKGDGVNVDFENVPASQRSNLVTFMQELVTAFHTELPGSQVTMNIPGVDWSEAFDEEQLLAITDGIVLMGYDYYWKNGDVAGPISPIGDSQRWGSHYSVTSSLDNLVLASKGNPQKIILGVPYYGYEWKTKDLNVPSPNLEFIESKHYSDILKELPAFIRLWDVSSQTPYYFKESDHQVWYEDAVSLGLKYDLVRNRGVAGIAIWALGYDGDQTELWALLEEKFTIVRTAEQAEFAILAGAGAGGGPHVRAFQTNGTPHSTPNKLFAYSPTFRGGVDVAFADIDGDGLDEIITAPGPGGGPHVRAFEKTGAPIPSISFMAYDPKYRQGVRVAAGDVDGDGAVDIVTGTRGKAGPHVRIFNHQGQPLHKGFFPFNAAARTGVSVAVADFDGDHIAEIVSAAATGSTPHVKVTDQFGNTKFGDGFRVFDEQDVGEINIATGDVDGDGVMEIVVSAGAGKAPWVQAFEADGTPVSNFGFTAYAPTFRGGVDVAVEDIDGDGAAEIITGAGFGGGPHVRAFQLDGIPIPSLSFFAYDPKFRGGVSVDVGRF
jgi:spore germination protein YaaH